MGPLSFSLALTLTEAGNQRARLAMEHGEESVFGKHLPVRELSVQEVDRFRTYFIGPVREGGRDQRLACLEIGMKP